MFKKTLISLAVASTLGLTGCFDSSDDNKNANSSPQNTPTAIDGKTWPIFNPATKQIPTPTDLSFSGSLDGTFKIELDEDSTPPVIALDSLSGASTVDPIILKTNGQLAATAKAANLIPNQTVFLIPLKYASGDPIQGLGNQEPPTVDAALATQTAFKVDIVQLDGKSAIRIVPTAPLKPNTRYVVSLTKDVKDVNGDSIIQDPIYSNITATGTKEDPAAGLVNGALAPIRNLVNNLWEPITLKYASAIGGKLSEENIALSYSLTTSNDVKVLTYIAEPKIWLRDQLENFVKVSTAKKVVGAALFAQGTDLEEENPSPLTGFQKWDLNQDGSIDAKDFDVNGDGSVSASDFDLNKDGKFDNDDTEAAVGGALAGFTPSTALNNPQLALCESENLVDTEVEGEKGYDLNAVGQGIEIDQFACIAELLALKIGSELPEEMQIAEPDSRTINLGTESVEAEQKSAVLASVIPEAARGAVSINEASIKLPYHLGQPSATDGKAIQAGSWKADRAFATVLNGAFKDAGLVLPQGAIWQDGEDKGKVISEAVNSLFPFPASTGDIEVPMLILHPSAVDVASDDPLFTDVVIFQHGITTDRSAALAFGSALVASGLSEGKRIAVVAIDQPLHGIAPATLEAKESTAKALLEGLQASEDEDLAPIKPLLAVTDANIDAAVSGTILDQVLVQVIGQQLAETPLAEQTATIANGVKLLILAPAQYSSTGNDTIDGTVQSFATDESIQTLVGTLAVAQQTVANSGSTIPGLTPISTAPGVNAEGVNERHFGWGSNPDYDLTLDVAPGNLPWAKLDFDLAQNPEEPGASGDLFINLGNFLNTRDNLRQGALDLLNLRASLTGVPAFASATVHFVGHSLGTVNGNAFVMAANASGREDLAIANSHLMTPASGIVRMLENSPSFAPTILGGLYEKEELTQQDGDLQSFFGVFQAAVDTVDPINYATEMQETPTLISQIDGDRTTINAAFEFYLDEASSAGFTSQWPQGYKPLQVGIGNLMINSPEAPLAGSEPLAAWSDATINRYPGGTHGTPVLPREEKAEAPNLAEFEFDILKNRKIAQGGEVITTAEEATATFKGLVGSTLQMILTPPPAE